MDETGALSEDVRSEMSGLIGDLDQSREHILSSDDRILTSAAFFHAKFETSILFLTETAAPADLQ